MNKFEVEVKGNYLYINGNVIQFTTEEEAKTFLIELILKGAMDN